MSSRLKKDTVTIRGEDFAIREWTALERAEFLKRSKEDLLSAGIYIAHRCTIKDDGKPYWAKESDAGGEPPELIDGLTAAICKLSGLEISAEDESKKD
jgi:hypothetical protein